MRVQDEDKPYDDINITPMLDLAYVLLVIFIIMTTASVQGIKVNLPKASATPSLAKPQTKAITITQRRHDLSRYLSGHAGRTGAAPAPAQGADPEFPGDREGRLGGPVPEGDGRPRLLRRVDLTQVGLVTGKPPTGLTE